MKFILLTLILFIITIKYGYAQFAYNAESDPYTFNYKQVVIPATLILAGTTSLYMSGVSTLDNDVRTAIGVGHNKLHFDDYLQYAPIAAVWALDLAGVKSRHKFLEQTTIGATATLAMFAIVQSGKYIISRQRPNNAEYNSMPSGHTATTFMGAEFLRMEFRETSPWIGIAGYAFAATTAYMRVYNDRHWMTDTFVGAGVGILSVKIAYWLAPKLNEALWNRDVRGENRNIHSSISPYTTGEHHGVNCSFRF